jgi:hypothetical protein
MLEFRGHFKALAVQGSIAYLARCYLNLKLAMWVLPSARVSTTVLH